AVNRADGGTSSDREASNVVVSSSARISPSTIRGRSGHTTAINSANSVVLGSEKTTPSFPHSKRPHLNTVGRNCPTDSAPFDL
ncbi:hypothetical protein PFISCL1PPCAC_16365, partial [Pristionchus fissidentatus]